MNPTSTALSKITAWLVSFMVAHTPQSVAHRATLERAADDIVRVVYDEHEAPVFYGPAGRAETALQLAAIGALESQYREDVQAGHCRKTECDHGRAKCWFQVQPGDGLVLLRNGGYAYVQQRDAWYDDEVQEMYAPDDLLDEEACIRSALHMLRASWRAGFSLREYTGEKRGHEPKAKHRRELAREWLKAHPAPTLDVELSE